MVSLPAERHRIVAVAVGAVALFGTVVAAWLATSGRYDSTTEAQLRSLHRTVLVLAVPAVVLAEGALVYAVVRFRDTDEPAQDVEAPDRDVSTPDPPTDGHRLEVAWAVGTALLFALVGILSYQVVVHPAVLGGPTATAPSDEHLAVTVTADQYTWTVAYGESTVRTRDRLVLPANRTVTIRLTSRDVIHSLSVPALGLKRDAMPGQYTTVRTTPTTTGTYRLYCAEFCGAGHAEMTGTVEVRDPAAFDDWLQDRRSTTARDGPAGTGNP